MAKKVKLPADTNKKAKSIAALATGYMQDTINDILTHANKNNYLHLYKQISMLNKQGCIIIIEDDADDKLVLQEVFNELKYPNEIIFLGDGKAALDFLTTCKENPFLILSDINLPKLNGLELRLKLKSDADLHLKCIPYLFFTTAANHQAVIDAYSTSVQGFFTKPNTYSAIKEQIKIILDYWNHCSAPNNFLSNISK